MPSLLARGCGQLHCYCAQVHTHDAVITFNELYPPLNSHTLNEVPTMYLGSPVLAAILAKAEIGLKLPADEVGLVTGLDVCGYRK